MGLTQPGGQTLTLPHAFAVSFGVVLFYRGAWCPYCRAQLRAFQRAGDRLTQIGTKVAALSAADEATAGELVAKLGLQEYGPRADRPTEDARRVPR